MINEPFGQGDVILFCFAAWRKLGHWLAEAGRFPEWFMFANHHWQQMFREMLLECFENS